MAEIASVFGLDIRLVLVHAVNFGLALFVLWYFLYRPILNLIEERRARIVKSEVDADEAAKKLSEADATRQTVLAEANREAERIVSEGREYGKEKEAAIIAEAQLRAEGIANDARAAGEESKRALLAESKNEIAKMVVLGAERVLREKLDQDRATAPQ